MTTTDAAPPGGEDIDRRQLRRVQERFRAVGTARLERLRDMLEPRARDVVDLLPLLLHLNHPALPGYLSSTTPAGLSGYRPGPTTLALAHQHWRSFEFRPGKTAAEDIPALYLMGSSGTLGHADTSDLDVWVCYRSGMPPDALARLQRKVEALGVWARNEGTDTHLFLMNDEKFRSGEREPLTGENCGSAQHYLLLDEFYRTGILLAGRIPGWWLVPPASEENAGAWIRGLLSRRYVRANHLLDFGGLHAVPASEFVGAGVWQLFKAIESPYKSVLKLLLFELYAREFPAASPASADFKRAIHGGTTDIDELDPYLMVYRRIEAWLQQSGQAERLELARRCLYFKSGVRLSTPRGAEPAWQRRLMERLVTDWGWDAKRLALLDSRAHWNVAERATERNALMKELVHSYRFLAEFARRAEATSAIDAGELSVLGRKLHAAYERRAGKIDDLGTGASAEVAEAELSLCAGRDAAGEALWGVWRGLVSPRGAPAGKALRQSASVSDLLAWGLMNGVIGERTRITLRENVDGLSYAELETLLRELRELLRHGRPRPPDAAFAQAARPLSLLVLVNVATGAGAATGVQRVSSRSDALGYSAMQENLVTNIELLHCNSWGEVIAARHAGEEGLLRFLREYPPLVATRGPVPALRVRAIGPLYGASVETRVRDLLACVGSAFDGSQDVRYVLSVAGQLHLLCREDGRMTAQKPGTEERLLQLLARPRRNRAALVIDPFALQGSSLPVVSGLLDRSRTSVFRERLPQGMRLLVADERGSVLVWTVRGAREASALAALAQFLRSVRYRQITAGATGTRPAAFHALQRGNGRGGWSAERLADPALPGGSALHVQALAGQDGDWTVYCDATAFSQRELGEAFAPRLSAHIRSLRRGRADYPVYITDLDLSAIEGREPMQTIEYLARRLVLEQALNAVLVP